MGKTVWILGAGFSRSLGGPLLPQLFAPGAGLRIQAAFPERNNLYEPESEAVRVIYSAHHDAGQELWRDAEEFLDYVDTAQAGGAKSPANQLLRKLLDGLAFDPSLRRVSIDGLASTARRLLVAECSAFLVDADVGMEKWHPYTRWADLLQPGDVVITFNYDLVIEKLQRGTPARDKLRVLLPSLTAGRPSPLRLDETRVSIIKLHGSANWFAAARDPSVVQVVADTDDYCALECPDDKMVIASPGPTKFLTVNGLLSPLWEAAKVAIKMADAIVFIGYRFPPTDSTARRELIEAIAGNNGNRLNLHTVLGENVSSSDTLRLTSMLLLAMRRRGRVPFDVPTDPRNPRFSMTNWPLRAEDFLDLYVPDQL